MTKYADLPEDKKQKHREAVKRHRLKKIQYQSVSQNDDIPPNNINKIVTIINIANVLFAGALALYTLYCYL